MIVLDTNVLSELLRATPDPTLLAWAATVPDDSFVTTTVTEAEMRFGVARMPQGKRRDDLAASVEAVFAKRFADRILPFGSTAAPHYATFLAARRAAGRAASMPDAMIAAAARAAGAAAIATRDTDGFAGCGLPLINPWRAA